MTGHGARPTDGAPASSGDAASVPGRVRLLTFRSGGWVLVLSGMLCAAVVAWRGLVVLRSLSVPTVGDGEDVATYGFDLATCLVPRTQLVAAGFPKDGLPMLTKPTALTMADAEELSRQMKSKHLGKLIVDKEAVLGVVAGGHARAYPLRILTWHEVVNDELGGVPIAVTYNPLCNSAVVFERQLDGETLEFGVSGLLYNSNLLMYDRRPEGTGESLWSQLQFRAIAGPAAECAARLTVLPSAVLPWHEWRRRRPDTTLLAPDLDLVKTYQRTYGEYFGTDDLRFPVAPLPPHDIAYKTAVIAVRSAERWHVFSWDQIGRRVGADGIWQAVVDGQPVRLAYRRDPALVGEPAAVWVETDDPARTPAVAYSFWFAWYALHPEAAALEN